MNLTIAIASSRENPCFEWTMDSIRPQVQGGEHVEFILVDLFKDRRVADLTSKDVKHVEPKPTVWQGKHRLTQTDWWAKSNALNTAICLCKTEWIAFVDDRAVVGLQWLQCVREAIQGKYVVCGSYEKRHNMAVSRGIITKAGEIVARDHREDSSPGIRANISGAWFFGCTSALPIEWVLAVNGFEELMDGLSAEDTHFGAMLKNNGFDLRYDARMKIIEDRTPTECFPVMRRTSKERWSNDEQDKGHEAIRRFGNNKQSAHRWNFREIRQSVLAGNKFPNHDGLPNVDWFDGEPISQM